MTQSVWDVSAKTRLWQASQFIGGVGDEESPILSSYQLSGVTESYPQAKPLICREILCREILQFATRSQQPTFGCVTNGTSQTCLSPGMQVMAHKLHTLVGDVQTSMFKEIYMRTLLSIAVLMSVALPVLARDNPLPEPSSFALLGIGTVGLLLALRKKK
jgi:hypothetical protein